MSLTLRNNSPYVAQFVVRRGDLIVARLPGLAPGEQIVVPSEEVYEVVATTHVLENSYTTAPQVVSDGMALLAQMLQAQPHAPYDFEVVQTPLGQAGLLKFMKTSLAPVTFSIQTMGRVLQTVVVQDSYLAQTLVTSGTHFVYAVINGVTTQTLATVNPDAVITVVQSESELPWGYFTVSEGVADSVAQTLEAAEA